MKINGNILPGVRMGKGFKDELMGPIALKGFVTNSSRLEHGERVVATNPKFQKRSLNLEFEVVGSSKADFEHKKDTLFGHFYSGVFVISELPFTSETFNLVYTGKSVTYSSGLSNHACKVKASFDEPNPGTRVHMESFDRVINISFPGGDTHRVEGTTIVVDGGIGHEVDGTTMIID